MDVKTAPLRPRLVARSTNLPTEVFQRVFEHLYEAQPWHSRRQFWAVRKRALNLARSARVCRRWHSMAAPTLPVLFPLFAGDTPTPLDDDRISLVRGLYIYDEVCEPFYSDYPSSQWIYSCRNMTTLVLVVLPAYFPVLPSIETLVFSAADREAVFKPTSSRLRRLAAGFGCSQTDGGSMLTDHTSQELVASTVWGELRRLSWKAARYGRIAEGEIVAAILERAHKLTHLRLVGLRVDEDFSALFDEPSTDMPSQNAELHTLELCHLEIWCQDEESYIRCDMAYDWLPRSIRVLSFEFDEDTEHYVTLMIDDLAAALEQPTVLPALRTIKLLSYTSYHAREAPCSCAALGLDELKAVCVVRQIELVTTDYGWSTTEVPREDPPRGSYLDHRLGDE